MPSSLRWDLFCQVIDNHGDAGVCWRVAAELARRGDSVRLWIDDPSPLAFMAPEGAPGVSVLHWTGDTPAPESVGDAVIEAFGCNPPEAYVAALAAHTRATGRQPAWINLEYLSAEPWVERSHGLPSPVMSGPGAGLVKRFVYPGFTGRTGGLLREGDLLDRQAAFDPAAWRAAHGLDATVPAYALFCYEPPALSQALAHWQAGPERSALWVAPGRPAAAVQGEIGRQSASHNDSLLSISYLPWLSQREFDHLLWAADFNLVRGEDSWVRALWAGRPFVWQAYPQDDGAHSAKLEAFLDWLDAPAELRRFHRVWNGLEAGALPALTPAVRAAWGEVALAARARALAGPSLADTLRQAALRPG